MGKKESGYVMDWLNVEEQKAYFIQLYYVCLCLTVSVYAWVHACVCVMLWKWDVTLGSCCVNMDYCILLHICTCLGSGLAFTYVYQECRTGKNFDLYKCLMLNAGVWWHSNIPNVSIWWHSNIPNVSIWWHSYMFSVCVYWHLSMTSTSNYFVCC